MITKQLVSFEKALEALKKGNRISRLHWQDSFIFLEIPSEKMNIYDIVKSNSLPDSVKNELEKRGDYVRYVNRIAIVSCDSTISNWSSSCEDILTEDWIILDYIEQ